MLKFIKHLENLKMEYKNDFILRKNGTLLMGINKVPKSRFELYAPLTDENIYEYLVSQYKNPFPKELIEFYKYSNGATLYIVKINTIKHAFAYSLFSIDGLPLTSPYSRPQDEEEPFDIRVEDLARHKDIPKTWLKCGRYSKVNDLRTPIDIFIDTLTGRVYSCIKNEKDIVDKWDNLDECFCSIFEELIDSKPEYMFSRK